MEKPTATVLTADPTRTFWEKITILHKEANRINGEFPPRYARHYYDLYMMYDVVPSFEDVMNCIEMLEREINAL